MPTKLISSTISYEHGMGSSICTNLKAVDGVANGRLQPALLRVDHEADPRDGRSCRQDANPALHGLFQRQVLVVQCCRRYRASLEVVTEVVGKEVER